MKINHRPASSGAVISVCAVVFCPESDSSALRRFLPKPSAAMKKMRVKISVKMPFFIGITILASKDKAGTLKGVKSGAS